MLAVRLPAPVMMRSIHPLRRAEAESRAVVGFEVILGAYSPLSMAAMDPVSLSG